MDTPADPLTAFYRLVLGNPALHARLGAIETREDFVAAAVALAGEHGVSLDRACVAALIRPDPIGVSRWLPSPIVLDRWPARGWRPAWSVPTEGAPGLDWAWFGDDRLTAPFYEASARRSLDRPFSAMFRTRTDLAALIAGSPEAPPVPAGLIYHMTRCGSTLIAQMLATDAAHCVLSEPEPLEAVLSWAAVSDAPLDRRIAAIRAVVAALGRDIGGRRLFVKLAGWNTLVLPLLRAAFPDTPWAYVCRAPSEVLVSQLRQRSPYLIAGALPGAILDIADAPSREDLEFLCAALGGIGRAALDHWALGGGLLVDYADLPNAVTDRIAPHFGLAPDESLRAAMLATATRDAKVPGQRFTPDTAAKRGAAAGEVHAAATAALVPLHAALLALRHDLRGE
ncbi:Nif11-like leader peptide family natural product precursor [Sphingomonas sp. PAMC 26605]|uniref:Nif11-like leader peptide family natural product precursor n=1 Tax=Sphingomonas sp. PAMC 26605 TaxID=1112214 RepID=UPI00026CDD37|nr:Nif11-like leader peptide family natural product precursor [Sphingomonas sp. PAMC 26605]